MQSIARICGVRPQHWKLLSQHQYWMEKPQTWWYSFKKCRIPYSNKWFYFQKWFYSYTIKNKVVYNFQKKPQSETCKMTDGAEEAEYLTPVTSLRFKWVQKKLGYMKDHGLPGREQKACQIGWCQNICPDSEEKID